MKDVVDKCGIKGCVIDIDVVTDNDNCTSKSLHFFTACEEAGSFVTKLKEFTAATPSVDGGASVTYRTEDLEG